MGTAPRKTHSIKDRLEFMPVLDVCNFAYIILKGSRTFIERKMKNGQEFNSKIWSEEFQERALLRLGKLANAKGYLPGDVDFSYAPKIDDGDNYNVYLKTMSKTCGPGTFKRSVGIRLKNHYCYFVRTTLFHSTSQMIKNDRFLITVYNEVLRNLKDGVELRKVYHAALSYAEEKDKDLAKHLERELGFELCSNFKNELVVINSTSNATAKKGMLFALNINLIGLEEGGARYNLYYSDTVAVRKDQTPLIFITYEPKYTTIRQLP